MFLEWNNVLCIPVDPPSVRLKRTLSFYPPSRCFEACVHRHPDCAEGGEKFAENNHETTDFSWHCMTHSLVLASKSLPCRHQNMVSIQLGSDSQASVARLRIGSERTLRLKESRVLRDSEMTRKYSGKERRYVLYGMVCSVLSRTRFVSIE